MNLLYLLAKYFQIFRCQTMTQWQVNSSLHSYFYSTLKIYLVISLVTKVFSPFTLYFWFEIFQWRILTCGLTKKKKVTNNSQIRLYILQNSFTCNFSDVQLFQYNESHASVHQWVLTRRDADLQFYVTSRGVW